MEQRVPPSIDDSENCHLIMEQRVPPSIDDSENCHLIREQRVPPLLNDSDDFCCSCWLSILARLTCVALLFTLILLLHYFTSKPSVPHFCVNDVAIIGAKQDYQFDITMKFQNPSIMVDLYHKTGGKVNLSHEGKQISSTEPPNFFVVTKDTTEVKMSLKSSNSEIHQDLTSTTKESKDIIVPLSLSGDITVITVDSMLGEINWGFSFNCELKLSKMEKEVKVVAQYCKEELS